MVHFQETLEILSLHSPVSPLTPGMEGGPMLRTAPRPQARSPTHPWDGGEPCDHHSTRTPAPQPGDTAPSCGDTWQRLHAQILPGPGSAPGWQKPCRDDAPNPGEAQRATLPGKLGAVASQWCWPMPKCIQHAQLHTSLHDTQTQCSF